MVLLVNFPVAEFLGGKLRDHLGIRGPGQAAKKRKCFEVLSVDRAKRDQDEIDLKPHWGSQV